MSERGFYESAYPDSDEEHQRQKMLKPDPHYVQAFNAGWRECEQAFRRAIRELSRDGKLQIAPGCGYTEAEVEEEGELMPQTCHCAICDAFRARREPVPQGPLTATDLSGGGMGVYGCDRMEPGAISDPDAYSAAVREGRIVEIPSGESSEPQQA